MPESLPFESIEGDMFYRFRIVWVCLRPTLLPPPDL